MRRTYGLEDILTALSEWAQETTRESGERLREVILICFLAPCGMV